MNGLLAIISSPSGGGKTAVINGLKNKPNLQFEYSISVTTRKPRRGEIHGKDYIFVSDDEFRLKVEKNELIEWEKVHKHFYGTPKRPIENWLSQGKIVLMDIDVNGGLNIKNQYPKNSITIFIEPPSLDELIKRLKNRKTESAEQIDRRLQRVPFEIEKRNEFDYVIVNDHLEDTINQALNIINNHH